MNNRSEMVDPFSMPAKKQASRARNQPQNQAFTEEKKDKTIAFVLCHPLECSLEPITCELPPCLFPVCNSPALLYTLNWLNVNGIEQIYVVCATQHAKAITKVVQQCRDRMLMESIKVLPTDDEKTLETLIRNGVNFIETARPDITAMLLPAGEAEPHQIPQESGLPAPRGR